MLTAIIIDDELKGRIALKQKLHDYCADVQLAGEAENGDEGIKLIEKYKPDVVFLDIEMPRMDGFQMLRRLPEKDFHLIFTTAYDQYAIKAMAVSKMYSDQKIHTAKKLEVLEQNMGGKNVFNKIVISTFDGLLFFNINDIVHLEASSNYTIIYFNNHPKLIASKILKEFEDLLPSDIFFRTHHSHIINLTYIKRYLKGDGGQIEMQNGNFVDVARRKKEEFLKIINR